MVLLQRHTGAIAVGEHKAAAGKLLGAFGVKGRGQEGLGSARGEEERRGSLGRARDEGKEGWKALGSARDEEREGQEALGSARGEGSKCLISSTFVSFFDVLCPFIVQKRRVLLMFLYLLFNGATASFPVDIPSDRCFLASTLHGSKCRLGLSVGGSKCRFFLGLSVVWV